MLDAPTKRRIDDCRDILVGKLPDPKSQIEQITIGLIYKFMDDMDKESIELGGKAKFFSDYKIKDPSNPEEEITVEFEKYSWDNITSPQVSANDLLKLYSEAIENMEKNPNIPQLFRDIFKNAYLPYRDPETLKMFLKEIGSFEYTHSEKLGDAFEYLLSIMGSQGDAGQFRTPRHIIDFLVKAVDPDKKDKILDPACGTAGFLVSAFKHIKEKSKNLTPDERKKLIQNFIGYDISPDMVRMSLVNLYLHGFTSPHIYEYDSLTSEDRWDDRFDVVLANPPFMSPKGGIRPHSQFTVKSNRSEVLFVDYIAEHLNPKGRAGIIVPEGVIFQSGKAYKELRKMLVENHLYAVVSLPAGIFNPYSGVKTSILLMDRQFAKKSNEILFVKVDNDGFNLGAQRNAVKGGQLEESIQILKQFKAGTLGEIEMAHAVLKSKIADNGDYNLSGERYKETIAINSDFPIVELGELVNIKTGKKNVNQNNPEGKYPFFTCAKNHTYSDEYSYDDEVLLIAGNGDVGDLKYYKGKFEAYQRTYIISTFKRIRPQYLFYYLKHTLKESVSKLKLGNTMPYIKVGMLLEFKIPLPPLSVQEEIVAEIEGYQKIIDGAKMVVENYKPKIDIDPDWEMVELREVCESISDGDHQPPPKSESGIPFITISNINKCGFVDFSKTYFVPTKYYNDIKPHRKPQIGDVLYTVTGSFGIPVLIDFEKEFCFQRHIGLIRPNSEINSKYLFYFLMSPDAFLQAERVATGIAQKTVSLKELRQFKIPKPPMIEQLKIVLDIQKEQELVNSSKQLIEIFEQKIKDRISKVWGEEKSEATPELSMAAESVGEYEIN